MEFLALDQGNDDLLVFGLEMIVLQPTTLCNLDCQYCYLPLRSKSRKMPVSVVKGLANFVDEDVRKRVRIVWHGGEPLSCGIKHFREMLGPFTQRDLTSKVQHNVQTNATLINDEWCELFNEYEFEVGVSIDGPEELNNRRMDLRGANSYQRALNGITCLKDHNIPFSIISVVSEDVLNKASEIYDFAKQIGCKSLCINMEEKEGINERGVEPTEKVKQFWRDLYESWRDDPSIRVREFDRLLRNMKMVCDRQSINTEQRSRKIDIFPSISSSGDVYLLSPEFLDVPSDGVYSFVVGNILDESLREILERGRSSRYVQDFLKGISKCMTQCPYYVVCGGGQASNRYFEHKNINTSETSYCKNTKMALTDAVLELL